MFFSGADGRPVLRMLDVPTDRGLHPDRERQDEAGACHEPSEGDVLDRERSSDS
jgi:hypothetical protein